MAQAAKSILLADLGAVGFVDTVEAASGKATPVACRLVSPDAFWATQDQTCGAGWSWGVVVGGVGDDRRSDRSSCDWASCGCAAQVVEYANLGHTRLGRRKRGGEVEGVGSLLPLGSLLGVERR